MKLAKKILILTLMAALFTSTAAIHSKNVHSEATFLADTETPDYGDYDIGVKHPHSIHTIKAV